MNRSTATWVAATHRGAAGPQKLPTRFPITWLIATWEQTSGLEVDPEAYRWWKGLAQVKAQGIWQGAVRAFMEGTTGELSQAMIGIRISVLQDRETLSEIGWSDESG
ncbi:MAG: hypothetical protein J4G09_09480 [Proteobacteria bacterium]|nr:hypothetical protein [Pseudomonadota bacterium]